MAPTRIRQDQIQDLETDLSSFESIDDSLDNRISLEESIDDSIEDSLEAKISQEESESDAADDSLEVQIDNLKNAMLSLVFGNRLNVMVDGSDLFAITPTEFAIPVISTTWAWYLNTEIISGETSSFYRPMITGNYKASVTYITNLGSYVLESDPIFFDVSK